MADSIAEPTRVYVCITCRQEGDADPVRAGARLHATLAADCGDDTRLDIIPVECLSVCRRPCTVAFDAPGKWSYVYGGLPSETSAATLRQAALLYHDTPDGLIPWKLRPDAIKKGVVARIPPLPEPKAAS